MSDPTNRELLRISAKKQWANPQQREYMLNRHKEATGTLQFKEKISQITKNRLADAANRGKIQLGIKRAHDRGSYDFQKKPIKQLTLNNEVVAVHESITKAMENLGKTWSTRISKCLLGRRKSAFGFKWELLHLNSSEKLSNA